MTDWTTIYGDVDGSPIRGVPDEFQGAGDFFEQMQEAGESILDEFREIDGGGVDELQGEAAVAFAGIVDEVANSLSQLPRVSGEAAELLHGHVGPLTSLKEQADIGAQSALARARLNWEDRNQAQGLHDEHDQRVRQFQRWINALPNEGEDDEADRNRERWTRSRNNEARWRDISAGEIEQAQTSLNTIRIEWDELRATEERLSEALDDAIDGIDLGSLNDPGLLSKIVSAAVDIALRLTFLDELFQLAWAFVDALLLGGDWGEFLWRLTDVLEVVLTVVAIVALFTPLGPIILAVVAGLAILKLAVDLYLWKSQTPHPDTGETRSGLDVIISAVGAATAGTSAGLAKFGKFTPASFFGNSLNQTPNSLGIAANGATNLSNGFGSNPVQQTVQIVIDGADAFGHGQTTGGFVHGDFLIVGGNAFADVPSTYDFSIVVNGQGVGDVLGPSGPVDFDFELPNIDLPFNNGLPFDIDAPFPVIVDIEIDLPVVHVDVNIDIPVLNTPIIDLPDFDVTIPSVLVPNISVPD